MMTIDPKIIQWAASILLILSGVQNLVGINVQRSVRTGLRAFAALISLAAIGLGIFMLISLLGVRV